MKKWIFFLSLLFVSINTAMAAEPITDVSILSTITSAMAPATSKILNQAVVWLTVFSTLQFLLVNYKLLLSDPDIGVVVLKVAGSITWMGVCAYLMYHGPAFIGAVGKEFFELIGGLPSPGAIMASTTILTGTLGTLAVAAGVFSNTAGQLILYALIFIFFVGMFFAVKIFMVQLELGLIVMLAPLSFSFLGLNALREQGIAPFKSLISLGYRILIMTVVLAAFTEISSVVIDNIKGISITNLDSIGTITEAVLSGGGAYLVLMYLLYKSDAIAASLAGGSTSMGTADVAGAVAAAAATGAAIGAGAGAVPGAAATPMSAVMNALRGNTGSISNASSSGMGGANPVGAPPSKPASASLASHPARPASGEGRSGMDAGAGNAPKSAANDAVGPGTKASGNDTGAAARSGSGKDPATQNVAGRDGSSAGIKGATTSVPRPGTENFVGPMPQNNAPEAPATNPANPASTGGDGSSAGLSGGSEMEKKLGQLIETINAPKQPTLGERLSEANRHVAQESAATHVSINTNAD